MEIKEELDKIATEHIEARCKQKCKRFCWPEHAVRCFAAEIVRRQKEAVVWEGEGEAEIVWRLLPPNSDKPRRYGLKIVGPDFQVKITAPRLNALDSQRVKVIVTLDG